MRNKIEDGTMAIEIRSVNQVYRLYDGAASMAIDALGLNRFRFWRKSEFSSFQALKNVSLKIRKGERVGIIGRNGAGKTTLLKLITQNYEPTSGEVVINGTIQSLMDQGVGFHPEFTGRQNIRSALVYNGVMGAEATECEKEILDFVELDQFIDQPIKTYSLGMKARLGFAVATAIKPDILIVDEVLGAGDAYFASKSALRMKNLTKDGVTLLLVSHSNSQILQFCERAIWIEKGSVVADGTALEVVKAYDRFIRDMENKNLSEKNMEAKRTEPVRSADRQVSRWAGLGSLRIEAVQMIDSTGSVCSSFRTGGQAEIQVSVQAVETGEFPCIANIYVYSMDGRALCQFTSAPTVVNVVKGQTLQFSLVIERLLLGNGEYVFSSAIYRALDYGDIGSAKFYDLVDRSFAFKVYSDFESDHSTFVQPAKWSLSISGESDEPEKIVSEAVLIGRSDLGQSYRD